MSLVLDDLRAADGMLLRRWRWQPPAPVRGEILLVHGLGEHLGRYERVGAAAAARGWRVHGVDLRGHGRSAGRRGHVRSWTDYVADLEAAAGGLSPGHAVLAHSMGGLVALDWLRERQQRVAAVALSSPLLGVSAAAPAWKVALGRLLSRLAPALPLANGLPPDGICSDPAVVRAYLADPLIFRTVTPRWFVEMERALERVHDHAGQFRLPLYLNLAGDERLVSNPRARALAAAWGGAVETHEWEALRHETLNEAEGPRVLAAILDWLERSPAAG